MPRDTWSKWHRIYSVDPILYKSSHLKPLSPLEVLGEFAKNRFGKYFPVAVIVVLKAYHIVIHYLDNTTLYLVVTPRHDKKLLHIGYETSIIHILFTGLIEHTT